MADINIHTELTGDASSAIATVEEFKSAAINAASEISMSSVAAQAGGIGAFIGRVGGFLSKIKPQTLALPVSNVTDLGSGIVSTFAELAEKGADADRVARLFEVTSGGSMEADANLIAMRRSINGIVDDVSLMDTGFRLMNAGLGDTSAELAAATRAGTILGATFGDLEPAAAAEGFALMLETADASPASLARYGLSLDEVNARTLAVMKTNEGLTAQQATQLAILDVAEGQAETYSGVLDDQAASLDLVSSTWEEVTTVLGRGVSTLATAPINFIDNLFDKGRENADSFALEAASLSPEEFDAQLQVAQQFPGPDGGDGGRVLTQAREQGEALQLIEEQAQAYTEQQHLIDEAIQASTDSVDEFGAGAAIAFDQQANVDALLGGITELGPGLTESFDAELLAAFITAFSEQLVLLPEAISTASEESITALEPLQTIFNETLPGAVQTTIAKIAAIPTAAEDANKAATKPLVALGGKFVTLGGQAAIAAGKVRSIQSAINALRSRTVVVSAVVEEPRAHGGPVAAGRPYIVGEQGEELFVPSSDGIIVPAPQTRSLLSGASGVSAGRGAPSGAGGSVSLNVFGDELEQMIVRKVAEAFQQAGIIEQAINLS